MTVSLTKYAAHRRANNLPGGTLRSIQVAIAAGRLAGALDERGRIVSIVLADAAMLANTDASKRPLSGPTSSEPIDAEPIEGSLLEWRTRRERAAALMAERDLGVLEGRYLDVDDARADLRDTLHQLRNRMLGVASKARQRDRSLTAAQLELVDDLIREALTDFANHKIGDGLTAEALEPEDQP